METTIAGHEVIRSNDDPRVKAHAKIRIGESFREYGKKYIVTRFEIDATDAPIVRLVAVGERGSNERRIYYRIS